MSPISSFEVSSYDALFAEVWRSREVAGVGSRFPSRDDDDGNIFELYSYLYKLSGKSISFVLQMRDLINIHRVFYFHLV